MRGFELFGLDEQLAAVLTNNAAINDNAHKFSDHGHIDKDRGTESQMRSRLACYAASKC